MDRLLTREQIEALILAHEDEPAHERPVVTNRNFIDICRLALSQEAVRDEVLEEFPIELMSHSMDDDKRLMARKLLKLKRVEKAYCAANDYINALTGTASILPESLEKIKTAYWQAVREVQ